MNAEQYSKEESSSDNYNFKSMKVYSSVETIADNKKIYRTVFERKAVSFIYCELSFYNIAYEREDWDAEILLTCYRGRPNNSTAPLCELKLNRKISKFSSIAYIREGWGHENLGFFWNKGNYFWKAEINGEKVGIVEFYIEDLSSNYIKDDVARSYLTPYQVRLLQGEHWEPTEVVEDSYVSFRESETDFITAELTFENNFLKRGWNCELIFRFFTFSRELKGEVVVKQRVRPRDKFVTVRAPFGGIAGDSWFQSNYSLEISMGYELVAIVPFTVTLEEIQKGLPKYYVPQGDGLANLLQKTTPSTQSFSQLMTSLDSLVGLKDIKEKVLDHAQYIKFLRIRKSQGYHENDDLIVHSVFLGNPGTGKTTIAHMMGSLYREMGLLTSGHVHEVDRVDLVGEYIGQTAPKTKEAIEKARGGVLFIDEAYSLARTNDDSKDFGREAIEILLKAMSSGQGDLMVIAAGYPSEMKFFLDSNPGLKSRFKLFFNFPDYHPNELMEIADLACLQKEVKLTPEARERVEYIITNAFRTRDKAFGNARFVYDTIEKAKINLGLRVLEENNADELKGEVLEVIKLEDIHKLEVDKNVKLPEFPIDDELLASSLAELDELIGLDAIKTQIKELVDIVYFHRKNNRNVLRKFFMHTVFVGNPGTGKTTVARILTNLYKALGLLERGHLVETDRQGLVAGFVGQTAIKTDKKIEEAIGGVLFIDEAYALTSRVGTVNGDFGDEAIQTLLKRMEDKRGEFFVFAAGYPSNMERFIKGNPGLASRFDRTLRFDDYSPEEMYKIAESMIAEEGYIINKTASNKLREYLTFIYEGRDQYFGNARTVRQVVKDIIHRQNLRLASIGDSKRINQQLLTAADMVDLGFERDQDVFNKKRIGFSKR